jgi:hypothetical protein
MSKIKKTFDVFLSYSCDSADEAKVIIKKFTDAGFSVFGFSEIGLGKNIIEEIWQALAECWAVVVLIKTETIPPSVAVEIGAASAWQKPIYIIMESKGKHNLPFVFSKYEVFSISEIEKVVNRVQKASRPLNENEQNVLVKVYLKLGIPADTLLMQPASIDRLNDMLQQESGLRLSGERIMQALLRLRKRGNLPRVSKK